MKCLSFKRCVKELRENKAEFLEIVGNCIVSTHITQHINSSAPVRSELFCNVQIGKKTVAHHMSSLTCLINFAESV